jgi:hypothetical protein
MSEPDDHSIFPGGLDAGCPCGGSRAAADHAVSEPAGDEAAVTAAVQTALLRAVFPDAVTRRGFVRAVGAGTALAALREVFPLDAAIALAQTAPDAIEKKQLKIGFIPITCATPIKDLARLACPDSGKAFCQPLDPEHRATLLSRYGLAGRRGRAPRRASTFSASSISSVSAARSRSGRRSYRGA